MEITARLNNGHGEHRTVVSTAGAQQEVAVAAKAGGAGSAVNGGEFLMLALATCYCNDLYREAAQLGIVLDEVEVEASADFNGIGMAAENVRYRARVVSPASEAAVKALLERTDAVAEVQNTLRAGVAVDRMEWKTDR